MMTSPTCTYDPPDLIPSTWPIIFWSIDANTQELSPLPTANVSNLKPNIARIESKPEAAIETSYENFSTAPQNLSTLTALVIMNPYEDEALMRFTASVSQNGLSSYANTLIDTATSLNFVSKGCVVTNGFYKDCKTDVVPKLSIRVASEQRISATKVFCPTVFTIDVHEFTDLELRVLIHFKGSDIKLGLPALKKLEVAIHTNLNSFTMGDYTHQ